MLRDRQSECVTPASDQNDFNPLRMGVPKSRKVDLGNLELGIEQGAIDINGNQANGIDGHKRF